ncbi:hypothetical protein [Polyangium sp. y55x31]|uniref:hypothetical protein n=1 Tax=Polyangium sp. y55x31 TaxID=3042688 RepID=UPI002482AC15|nr:hypothetical protein [Polyangium sp. y55x31]MDI1482343.1 hypothetical protein [Polyangium sp. y55x31]
MTALSAPRSTEEKSGTSARRPLADVAALKDRRFLSMLPVILCAMALPFAARLLEPMWIDASAVAQARFFARLCVVFLLLACFPAVLILIRLGVTDVTAGQHRTLLAIYPALTSIWQSIVGLDGLVLVAWPAKLALPHFVFDVVLSVLSAVLIPFVLHHQAWFYGFDADSLRRAREVLRSESVEGATRPLDTLDYRVLQLVGKSGSDIARVMINDMGIGHRDLMLRLQKLVALGYLELVEEMHGPQVVLTTLATDTLALPVSLFTWDTDDRETLRELASARLSLEAREPQRVVVACARLAEMMLKRLLSRVTPPVTQVGGKDIGKATLGELVQACRQHKRIGKFEDSVFGAINERRKKIHARDNEEPIDDQDAFVIYTLTEIVAREVLRRGDEAPAD